MKITKAAKQRDLSEIRTFAESVLVDQGIRLGNNPKPAPSDMKAKNLACAVIENWEQINARAELLQAAEAAYRWMHNPGADFTMVEDETGVDVREVITALGIAIKNAGGDA